MPRGKESRWAQALQEHCSNCDLCTSILLHFPHSHSFRFLFSHPHSHDRQPAGNGVAAVHPWCRLPADRLSGTVSPRPLPPVNTLTLIAYTYTLVARTLLQTSLAILLFVPWTQAYLVFAHWLRFNNPTRLLTPEAYSLRRKQILTPVACCHVQSAHSCH